MIANIKYEFSFLPISTIHAKRSRVYSCANSTVDVKYENVYYANCVFMIP